MGTAAFAPVASLPIYRRLLESGELGTYQLLIASEVLKDSAAWQEFWSFPSLPPEVGKDQFIIMDNGLIETGFPLPATDLELAAAVVDADCIVMPDVLGQMKMTLKLVRANIDALHRTGYPLLGVLQGDSWGDIAKLLDEYAKMNVKYISVPRVMTEIHGSRVGLVHAVADRWQALQGSVTRPHPFIHLLGFSNNLFDDMLAAQHPEVMGIDSAVPIWYALKENEYFPHVALRQFDVGKRPENYWEMLPDDHRANFDIVLANVRKVRGWLRRGV